MNMNKGSMVEVAIKILNDNGTKMSFANLWSAVKAELEITAEEEAFRVGHFYSDLSLSGKVMILDGNDWDLISRHTFEERQKVKLTDVYHELEQKDDDQTEAQEEAAYDQSVNGVVVESEQSEEGAFESDEDGNQEKDRRERQEAAELIGEGF